MKKRIMFVDDDVNLLASYRRQSSRRYEVQKDLQAAYVDSNGAFADFLGRFREDVIGRTAFELCPPEEARRYHNMDQDLLAAGGQQSYQSTVTTTAASWHRHPSESC